MESIDELIQIANDSCDFEVLTTSITEKDALSEGRKNLQRTRTNLSDAQAETIFKEWKFPMIASIFDTQKGNISSSGMSFLKESRTIHCDLDLLFCFFSKHDSCPSSFEEILDEPMNPFSFFCFTQELFEALGVLQPAMEAERKALSEIVRRVLLATTRLLRLSTVRSLNSEVMSIANDVDSSVSESISPIIQQCFTSAIFTQILKSDTVDKARDTLIESVCPNKTKLEEKYAEYSTYPHMISQLHLYASHMDSDWLYPSKLAPDLVTESRRSVIKYSELAGEVACGCASDGNHLVTITVEWEKKFVKSRLANVTYLEVQYMNNKWTMPVTTPPKEIIIPAFPNENLLSVRLVYVKKKYAKSTKESVPQKGYGVLGEISVPVMKESNHTTMKYKRRSSVLARKCGTISVDLAYYPSGTPVPITNPDYPYENVRVAELLDFYVGRMVEAWMQQVPFMGMYPPCSEHLALLEFSLRYGIPASALYLAILDKLIQGWCHAEGYLNALTATFLITLVCYEKCSKTPREERTMKTVIEFLKTNVPSFMLQHLSKPALYEKHALLPLFILSCCTMEEGKIEGYMRQIIDRSVKNIVHSITGVLVPSESDKEVKESESLRKYIIADRRQSVSPVSQFSNTLSSERRARVSKSVMISPGETETPSSPHIIFQMATLGEAAECLAKRSRQIKQFYEKSSLPSFVDHWDTLEKEFAELALALIANFEVVENQACERDLFRFIVNYKVIYKFLHLPESVSPYVIFTPIILNWISKIGEKMIMWVSRALKFDKFEIHVASSRISTSLVDMMSIFAQSIQFLHVLQWEDKSIDIFVESYLSLCASSLKMYVEDLSIRMLSYFPSEIVQHFDDKLKAFSGYINDVKQYDGPEVTQESVFIAMNDMFNIRPLWNTFLETVKAKFPDFNIPDTFANPVVTHVRNICKSVPLLFADLTAHETTKGVAPYLWVKNSKLKKFMSNKASKFVLNPLFMKKQSDLFNDMFGNTTSFLKGKIDSLNGNICAPYYHMMLAGLFSGLDAGLMNILVDRPDRKDIIKLKRLMPVVEFIRDVLDEVKDYALSEAEIEITQDLLDRATPYSQFVFEHMKDNPMNLARDDPRAANYMISLCTYIIVSAHNKNKDAIKWARDNKQLHRTRVFIPIPPPLR